MSSIQKVLKYIEQFELWEKTYAGSIPWSLRFLGNDSSYPHLYFSACIHGNEVGSLPALSTFIESLINQKIHYPGTITISLGNLEAMRAGVRFVKNDMNRHFGDPAAKGSEALRANELCQLIDECDIFVDLHQTIEPTTEPFYVISDTQENRYWAQALGVAQKAILRNPQVDTYLTATTYAYKQKKLAATIELSQKGFYESATLLTKKSIERTMELTLRWQQGASLESLSKNETALTFLIMAHYEKFDGPLCHLLPGWSNLSPIRKGQIFGKNHAGKDLFSPLEGYILFPKYIERDSHGAAIAPLPKDIITILKPVI